MCKTEKKVEEIYNGRQEALEMAIMYSSIKTDFRYGYIKRAGATRMLDELIKEYHFTYREMIIFKLENKIDIQERKIKDYSDSYRVEPLGEKYCNSKIKNLNRKIKKLKERIKSLNLNLSTSEPKRQKSKGDVCGGQTPQVKEKVMNND